MTDEIDILVNEDGSLSYIHDDRLVGAFDGEEQRTRRASHVEPADSVRVGTEFVPVGGGHVQAVPIRPAPSGWVADMRPSKGPVLTAADGNGFRTRQEALDAERAWLRKERGL